MYFITAHSVIPRTVSSRAMLRSHFQGLGLEQMRSRHMREPPTPMMYVCTMAWWSSSERGRYQKRAQKPEKKAVRKMIMPMAHRNGFKLDSFERGGLGVVGDEPGTWAVVGELCVGSSLAISSPPDIEFWVFSMS